MNMHTSKQSKKTPTSSVIGVFVIVLVLALGAYYFLSKLPTNKESSPIPRPEVATDVVVSALSLQGTSTELADIQNDLNATNLSEIDAELNVTVI